jgi:hypothetical protein
MKVSYSKGLATHTGSESCMIGGNARHEALTGVRAGQVLSSEIEPPSRSDGHSLVPTLLNVGGRQHWERRYGETLLDLARSETLSMYASTFAMLPRGVVSLRRFQMFQGRRRFNVQSSTGRRSNTFR